MPRGVIALVALLTLAVLPGAAAGATKTRSVLYVGNNWDGTADVVQPRKFRRIARINIIPDIDERMKEIQADPERYGYFLAIRQLVGEGHDQFVDDMFSSHNGRVLYVSRPSLADVVAINLRTRKLICRTKTTSRRTASSSTTRASARSSLPWTTRSSTRRRASASSRSSTRATGRS